MPRALKILSISYSFPPNPLGGYGLQMGAFCQGLRERGHQVDVLTGGQTSDGPGHGVLRLLSDSATPLQVATINAANVKAVRRAIGTNRPDFIFCGGMDFIGFSCYLAAIESDVPSLTWLGDTWLAQAWRNLGLFDRWHGMISTSGQGGLKRLARRGLGEVGRRLGLDTSPTPRSFGAVAAISQFVLDDLRTTPAPVQHNAPVVPIMLADGFFGPSGKAIGRLPSSNSTLKALFIGRIEMPKGPDVAIRAVAAAVRSGADITLTIAGLRLGELKPLLEKLAAADGISDRVAWAGTPGLPELLQLYRSHDVFLFPSRIVEGLGVVNCEALACGLPIIGTAHSGSAEVIVDGYSGFRVLKDDAESMARHLVELDRDRGRLARLSANCLVLAERFHPSRVMDLLESEILKQLSSGSPA